MKLFYTYTLQSEFITGSTDLEYQRTEIWHLPEIGAKPNHFTTETIGSHHQ